MSGDATTRLRDYREEPEVVIDEAANPAARMRIRREIEGRTWAVANGIRTPEIIEADPDGAWLVSRRVVADAPDGSDYLAAALEAADRIEQSPVPTFDTPRATWRALRISAPLRARRMAQAGLGTRAFLRARRAMREIQHVVTVHGDFHCGNVLNTASTGAATVVDWEHAGLGPRHHDHIRLVCTVPTEEMAELAWQRILSRASRDEWPVLAAHLRWMSLRTLAGEVSVPRRRQDATDLERARARWNVARTWASELDGEA